MPRRRARIGVRHGGRPAEGVAAVTARRSYRGPPPNASARLPRPTPRLKRLPAMRCDIVLAYLVKQAGMSLLSRASQVSSTAETRLPSG
jgi:hypothetical protein